MACIGFTSQRHCVWLKQRVQGAGPWLEKTGHSAETEPVPVMAERSEEGESIDGEVNIETNTDSILRMHNVDPRQAEYMMTLNEHELQTHHMLTVRMRSPFGRHSRATAFGDDRSETPGASSADASVSRNPQVISRIVNDAVFPATASHNRWRRNQSGPEFLPLTDLPNAPLTELHSLAEGMQ